MNRVRIPAAFTERDAVVLVNEDFTNWGPLASGNLASGQPAHQGWQTNQLSGNVVSVLSGQLAGKLKVTNISGDNNTFSMFRQMGIASLDVERPVEVFFRAQVQPNASGTVNAFVGVHSQPQLDPFRDNGAGMPTSGAFAGVAVLDGEQYYRGVSQLSGTANSTLSTTPAGTKENIVSIHIAKALNSPGKLQVSYEVDGAILKDSNGFPIRHELPAAGTCPVTVTLALKNGTGAADSLTVDLVQAVQHRGNAVP